MSHFKLSAGNKGRCALPQPDFGITQTCALSWESVKGAQRGQAGSQGHQSKTSPVLV